MNPLPILLIVVASMAFEGMIYGNEMAQDAFPKPEKVDYAECQNEGGVFDSRVGCVLSNFFEQVRNGFKVVFGVFAFIYKLVSFDVPGAPWYVRSIIATVFGIGILWPAAVLIRGN